jgi:hypothetical protein
MKLLYENWVEFKIDVEVSRILEAICRFIENSVLPGNTKVLVILQEGLSLWLQDENAFLDQTDQASMSQTVSAAHCVLRYFKS